MNTAKLPQPRRLTLKSFALVVTAAATLISHGAASAQSAVDAKALLPEPAHQAIFCGTDGGDASAAYSKAVARAINTVIERKAATDAASAIKLLKSQLCPPPAK